MELVTLIDEQKKEARTKMGTAYQSNPFGLDKEVGTIITHSMTLAYKLALEDVQKGIPEPREYGQYDLKIICDQIDGENYLRQRLLNHIAHLKEANIK